MWCRQSCTWTRKYLIYPCHHRPHRADRTEETEEGADRQEEIQNKSPAPRLCADEVMSRANLIRYQDTYAEQMAAYGLQRGIKGSEAQHISTHEYYRSLIAQGEDLQANISRLLEEQEKARLVIAEAEQAKKDLARIKSAIKREQRHVCMVVAECEQTRLKAKAEAKTEELKNSATKTATNVLNGVNSLLGGNKVNRLEKENAQLHREVEDLNGQTERLHTDIQKMKDDHARELNRTNEQHQQEVSNLKRILDKAYQWFPSFKRFLNMERECLQYGFNEEQTEKLLHGQRINYSGCLHSNEYRRNVLTDNVSAQVIRDEKRNLFLHINQMPIAQWFREQFGLSEKDTQRKGIRH